MELSDGPDAGVTLVAAPAGTMELWIDRPPAAPRALAIVAHQHPSQDGRADSEIPALMAAVLRDAGVLVLRPNFRGVGRSEGAHDHGDGETADMAWLLAAAQRRWPVAPILAGFSFGAFVMARLARQRLDEGRPPAGLLLLAMPFGAVHPGRPYDTPRGLRDALVIHGEQDERVPLSAVLDWARPDGAPVTVVPGTDHFFTGQLATLRALLRRHLRGVAGSTPGNARCRESGPADDDVRGASNERTRL
jgi:alpha/beta superfamily hydrolase